jgi:hypothetical protein
MRIVMDTNDTVRCMRCRGRKKIYKVRNIYSYTNTGGILVDCPMCVGSGRVKTLEGALRDAEQIKNKKASKGRNNEKTSTIK